MKNFGLKILAALCLVLALCSYPLMCILFPEHDCFSYCLEHQTWKDFDVGMLCAPIGIISFSFILIYSENKE